jgi:hypothetical protein
MATMRTTVSAVVSCTLLLSAGCGSKPDLPAPAPTHPLSWANGAYHCDRLQSPTAGASTSGDATFVITDGTVTGRMSQSTKNSSGLSPETIQAPYQFSGAIASDREGAVQFQLTGPTGDIAPGTFKLQGEVLKNGRCRLTSTSTVVAMLAEITDPSAPPDPASIKKTSFVLTLEGMGRRD